MLARAVPAIFEEKDVQAPCCSRLHVLSSTWMSDSRRVAIRAADHVRAIRRQRERHLCFPVQEWCAAALSCAAARRGLASLSTSWQLGTIACTTASNCAATLLALRLCLLFRCCTNMQHCRIWASRHQRCQPSPSRRTLERPFLRSRAFRLAYTTQLMFSVSDLANRGHSPDLTDLCATVIAAMLLAPTALCSLPAVAKKRPSDEYLYSVYRSTAVPGRHLVQALKAQR